MERLAIVGIFFDGYYDIWEDFLELKEKFWKDCPYPLYIVNNDKELNYEKKYGVTVLHAGADAEFSKRVQTAVQNIEAERYLVLLEDFFFGKPLIGAVLDKYLDIMDEHKLSYISMPVNGFLHSATGPMFAGLKNMHSIETSREYTVSCQAAIWDREFLKECIGVGNYNAWVFEGIYCKSKKAHTKEFLDKCKIDDSNYLCLQHGALQSKMLPTTIAYYEELGYKMKNQRPILDEEAYQKHLRKIKIKTMIPAFIQRIIKCFVKTNSVIERYKEDISKQMDLMKLQ